jgi:hypothetical protein
VRITAIKAIPSIVRRSQLRSTLGLHTTLDYGVVIVHTEPASRVWASHPTGRRWSAIGGRGPRGPQGNEGGMSLVPNPLSPRPYARHQGGA